MIVFEIKLTSGGVLELRHQNGILENTTFKEIHPLIACNEQEARDFVNKLDKLLIAKSIKTTEN